MKESTKKLVWPSSMAHLAYSYSNTEMVVIGEQSGDRVHEYDGERTLYAVLVPVDKLERLISHNGGISTTLESGCSGECDFLGHYGNGLFYIDGPCQMRYESLVCSWEGAENHVVVEPSPALLKHFGLLPRYMSDGSIAWDDMSRPLRNVITVFPCAQYKDRTWIKSAKVEIRRDYLHEYLYQNGCAAVAVFEECRYSLDDKNFSKLVGKQNGMSQDRPGIHLDLCNIDPEYFDGCNQRAEAWGCKVIMIPSTAVLTNDIKPKLDWPEIGSISCSQDASIKRGVMGEVFVSDSVLEHYEGRPEFGVYPESGAVSYGGQWHIGDCRRVGRNHIAVVLRKLYEGTPSDVIRQFHKFAVKETDAWEDERQNGKRNIGIRAKELSVAYLDLLDCLSELSFNLGLNYSGHDLGGVDRQMIEYEGLWRFEDFVILGHVVPIDINQQNFLSRCLELQKLLERLSVSKLRKLLNHFGVPLKQLEKFKQIKLLATICQFAVLAKENEKSLSNDTRKLKKVWDINMQVPAMAPLFALIDLRNVAGHKLVPKNLDAKIKVFGIDPQTTVVGWGKALDRVYDLLIESINGVTRLIREAM